MRRLRIISSIVCSYLMVAGSLPAQQPETAIRVDRPHGKLGWLTRPYQQPYIPPVNLANSDRLESLVRAGNLYLSAQDVIALTLENNLDIEIQRYGPLLNKEIALRAASGGILRDVGVGIAPGPTSVSTAGVSTNASGGATTVAGANATSSGGLITSVGTDGSQPGSEPFDLRGVGALHEPYEQYLPLGNVCPHTGIAHLPDFLQPEHGFRDDRADLVLQQLQQVQQLLLRCESFR